MWISPFATLLVLFPFVNSLKVETKDFSNNSFFEIFSSDAQNSSFDYFGQLTTSCVVPTVQEDGPGIYQRNFRLWTTTETRLNLTFDFDNSSLRLLLDNAEIKNNTLIFLLTNRTGDGDNKEFSLNYDCSDFNESDYLTWTIIDIKIVDLNTQDEARISYVQVCKMSSLNVFDMSLLILASLSMLIIFFGVRNQKIISLQRQFIGITIIWWMSFIYILLALVFMISLGFFWNTTFLIFTLLIIILCLVAVTFSLRELLYYLKIFECYKKSLNFSSKFSISIATMIYFLISIALVLSWFLIQNYFLTDILALFLVFASLKIFKIHSLKSGTIFLLIIGVFEIIQENIMNYWTDYPLEKFYSSDFCYPLKFEIPTFGTFLTKKCSWLSIANIIFPGLFLSYFHRFDSSKKIKVYFLMGFFGYLCGNLLWILISLGFAYSSPLQIYALPFMIGFCSILAYKRNENLDLWEGLFYDYELVFPNLKIVNEGPEIFEDKEEAFHKEALFEGLLESSFESDEREEGGKEMKPMGKSDSDSLVKSKIRALEEIGFKPGRVLNKEEFNKIFRKNKN